jgi:Winged helix DNA-binding domain
MLLRRHKSRVVSVVERVAGLQAQVPRPPFIGLWSRIDGFQRADLVKAIDQREIVRGTLMRATIHLVSRDDYIEWRPTIQPVLTRLMHSVLRGALHKFDLDRIVRSAEARFDQQACTFALVLKPFRKLDRRTRAALEEEGQRLLRFVEPDAETYAV